MNKQKFLGFNQNGPTIWLAYFIWYLTLWIFEPPGRQELLMSLLAFGAFLPVYYDAYYKKGHRAWFGIVAITLISLGMAFYTASASIFFIYAVMVAAQSQRGRARMLWLAGIIAVTIIPAMLGMVSWVYTGGCMLFGPLVAVSTATMSRLEEQIAELLQTRTEMRDMAITAERERIARDMHDTLGHVLSVITIKSDLALRLSDKYPQKAKQEMAEVYQTGRKALKQVRNVVSGMGNTTVAAEIAHARYLLETANIHTEVDNAALTLPTPYQHALGMIIREATTNIVKHANATRCRIVLSSDPHQTRLQICDNGNGGSFEPKTGLTSIKERATQLDGTYDIVTDPGSGTCLSVHLPQTSEIVS